MDASVRLTRASPMSRRRRSGSFSRHRASSCRTSAGVSVGTVRGIEHGYYKSVRPRVIRAIAETLGVQPADVVEFRPSLGLSAELSIERIERIERIEGETPPDPLPSPSAGYASPGA